MGMYKGPHMFEFVGAFVRWLVLKLIIREGTKKELFRNILAGEASSPMHRSWYTIFVNFFIGVIVTALIVMLGIYFMKAIILR